MLLTVFGLSDEAIITLVCMVFGGMFSLAGVYISLRLSINTLQANEKNDEKEIVEMKAEMKDMKGELWNNINEIKQMLGDIKVDIEKIRP